LKINNTFNKVFRLQVYIPKEIDMAILGDVVICIAVVQIEANAQNFIKSPIRQNLSFC
jgi:ssRNA-specific RNase YbeY (16S rRNA maturation enzyme)